MTVSQSMSWKNENVYVDVLVKLYVAQGWIRDNINSKLCLMNMAVHGLTGVIKSGDEANTFYHDAHNLDGCCDYVMANPPFNVDKVKSESALSAGRLPFGLPGVNKDKEVSNANYLWISYFYSYLNEHGRAGFVMASSATDWQLKNLNAIVWLYRGENDKYKLLLEEYHAALGSNDAFAEIKASLETAVQEKRAEAKEAVSTAAKREKKAVQTTYDGALLRWLNSLQSQKKPAGSMKNLAMGYIRMSWASAKSQTE